MIDSLFGSKTRVKLLGLFMNNPDRSFYVREITRNIGEQINSVRRELANLVKVGVVTDRSVDNKLYYQADKNFKYYHALREMFADDAEVVSGATVSQPDWTTRLRAVRGLKTVIFAGALVYGSDSQLDILLAGDNIDKNKAATLIKGLERDAGTSLNYAFMDQADLYYRLTVNDSFVMNVLKSKHTVVLDEDNLLGEAEKAMDKTEASSLQPEPNPVAKSEDKSAGGAA